MELMDNLACVSGFAGSKKETREGQEKNTRPETEKKGEKKKKK